MPSHLSERKAVNDGVRMWEGGREFDVQFQGLHLEQKKTRSAMAEQQNVNACGVLFSFRPLRHDLLLACLVLDTSVWGDSVAINLPTTASSRPTLGSFPAIADLNNGEFTTDLPSRRARPVDGAPWMRTCVKGYTRLSGIENVFMEEGGDRG